MSQWTERLNSHPIHAKLNELGSLLQQIEEKSDLDSSSIESISRIRSVHIYVLKILSGLDPNLVALQPLNQTDSFLSSLNSELSQFNSNNNTGHLSNAIAHTESLLIQVTQIPRIDNLEAVDGLRDATSNYRKSIGQFIRNIEEKANSLGQSLSQLLQKVEQTTAEISSQKSRLDTAITQFQQQFSETENSRSKQFSDAESARSKDTLDTNTKREEKFQEMLKNQEVVFTGKSTELQQQVEKEKESLQAGVKDFIAEIEMLKKRADDLVYVIANTGMVGGYQKIANAEYRAAIIWKLITVVSMIGLIGFAVVAANSTFEAEFNIAKFSARAFVSSTFGILAAYSARQASKNDEASRQNRKMELEIASIDPFLVGLPDELKHKIKERLASRMFGQKVDKALGKEEEATGTSLDTLKMMVESLHELIIKGK